MKEEMLKSAIKYCVDKGYGYYSDLVKILGKELVDEFHQVGFLKSGWTRIRRTWSATKMAETFKKDLDL